MHQRQAIDNFLHGVRDIKQAGYDFIIAAIDNKKKRFEQISARLEEGGKLLLSEDKARNVHGQKLVFNATVNFDRIKNSKIPEVLANSLFVSLFSSFDVFTGAMLKAFYEKKPELYCGLKNTVTFSEVLRATSIDELKAMVLTDEIESFRRESYVEQFSKLESMYGIQLRKFPRWPDFVECAQRRNLLTHCGGIVSAQYLKVCLEQGYPKSKLPKLNDHLILRPEYFFMACELVMEVGLKLGQTLWRKLIPDELEEADRYLVNAEFDALLLSNWPRAKVFGEFAVGLPKVSSDIMRRNLLVNYVIALKFAGEIEQALQVLATVDWSATCLDFRLAEAVLQDRYDDAAILMGRIGPESEFINEHAYHVWPLFREFRTKDEFARAYSDIYGHEFVAKLKNTAEHAQAGALEVIERSEHVAPDVECGTANTGQDEGCLDADDESTLGGDLGAPQNSNADVAS